MRCGTIALGSRASIELRGGNRGTVEKRMLSNLRKFYLTTSVLASAVLPQIAHAQDAATTTAPAAAPASTPAPAPASPAPEVAPATTAPDAAPAADANNGGAIVVTGTMFRRADRETPSPVSVLTSDDLAKRGITTITDAVQSLAAASGGGLPTSFAANGGFAPGASAVSLRGLTSDSTLVLFDGMRAASYPLADDGVRSFVDLNTIPDAIVDRVEVLKDGASSNYGADAIAGVVNVIIKKQITGVQGTVEGGISQRGDAGHQRVTLTAGYGDLDTQGFNVYVSGEYQRDHMLYNRDRGYPYNTSDLSRTLADDGKTPDANNNANASGVNQHFATTSAVVTPATEGTPGNIFTGSAIAGSNPQILNSAGCGAGTIQHSGAGAGSYCEQNVAGQYGVLQPQQTRAGVTARGTVKLGDQAEAYLMGTYYQNQVSYTGAPSGTTPSQPSTLRGLVLPATLRDGSTNPQDPFANIIDPATGQRESALLNYAFGTIPAHTTDTSRTFRIAGGVHGTFGDGWQYQLDGTYMHSKLDMKQSGLLSYGALQDAIETGSYNFVNPELNSQAELNALSPEMRSSASSSLWQVQGSISKGLMELPGGELQLGVNGQIRYESMNDPVSDPLAAAGGYSAYEFANVNLVSAVGHRYNEAASFELDAPIVKQLDLNVSGRYDHYSEGFSHFSPKVGVKFTPIKQLALRGTFSKGFRAPSIPETAGQVMGYVSETPPPGVVAAHENDAYVKQYSMGEFNSGNPNLKPELSTSFTGGAIIQPTRWLSFTADYYHIKKTNVIVEGVDDNAAINAYYNGETIPAGYSIITNPVDPAHPGAIPTINIVNASFVNAASEVTSGLDMSATARVRITPSIRFTSTIDVTRVFKLNITSVDGIVQHFAGTEGPFANTSDSGTPKWRGNWQNTLEVGKFTLTGTAYYTGGYRGTADDYAMIPSGDNPCDYAIAVASDGATSEQCHVKHFIDVDMTGSLQVNDKFTIYMNIVNLFDAKAPFDPNTYGGLNYNPVAAQAGVIGRFFKIGANFKF